MAHPRSAGLLLYRIRRESLELFLAHPGGPFFRNRDEGVWTIPKGIIEPDETPEVTALREFREEVGFTPRGELISLGTVRQKGGKVVEGFAVEGDLPEGFELESNTFEVEWPRNSGHYCRFLEVDRAEFFPPETARRKLNPAQTAFVDRLESRLGRCTGSDDGDGEGGDDGED
ncbi:MAG: NUDIX domain-containing protein [Spirochaetaceae bacterium]